MDTFAEVMMKISLYYFCFETPCTH